ncbi:MAG: ATP-binding protein [Bacteroidota bacterium]|nr:ATP-binding protein [Bacteroidota bacterium]
MDALEILDIIQKGESSTVQFKVRIDKKDKKKSAYDLGTEMVAFANTKGGLLIIGVVDETGEIDGLSYEELQSTNQLLAYFQYSYSYKVNIFQQRGLHRLE